MGATGRHELEFGLVDVFAQAPLTGNPLAVVLGATALDDALLARVAREFNQSETTFVLPARDQRADRRLRSFTPAGVEVVGAGHNALGAWWWLAARGDLRLDDATTTLIQELGDRCLDLTVTTRGGYPQTVAMSQAPAQIGPALDISTCLAADLRVAATDLAVERVPARVVSTGAPHLLLPVVDRTALQRIRPHAEQVRDTLADVGAQGCYAYTLQTDDLDVVAAARFFNPTVGIWEDPATGSAAGPLVAHIVDEGLAAPGLFHVVVQGQEMGRPSRIAARFDGTSVTVAGSCVIVAEGTLTL